MKVIICAVSVAVLFFPVLMADPDEIVLDGEAGCLELGGVWGGAGGCLVSRFFLDYRTRLVIQDGVTLTLALRCDLGGEVMNYGTLVVTGLTVNENGVWNHNLLINRGWIHPHGPIVNQAVFENEGFLDICSGTVFNRGYLHNVDSIDNWGRIVNEGLLVNDGGIHNPDLGFAGITNSGDLRNRGTVDNEGRILCTCGAAWYGPGTLRGNPPEFEACTASTAAAPIGRLAEESIALGPLGQELLSKEQVLGLIIPLGKASKWPPRNWTGRYESNLQCFVDQVRILVGDVDLPPDTGELLGARAAGLLLGSVD